MDWTKLTHDPCDPDVQQKMQVHLRGLRRIVKDDYMSWLLRQVEGRSCLDIGAVEHDIKFIDMPSWKHAQLAKVANRLVGVDILDEYQELLAERGYDIRFVDATSDVDLGEKFETVVLGDVVEHVENPVALLRFATRHLAFGGQIIVKTPNPYYIDNIIKFARSLPFVNFEHIAWYTPTMALEIGRRAGCPLVGYLVFPRKRPWCNIFSNSDIFTRDFVYVYENHP